MVDDCSMFDDSHAISSMMACLKVATKRTPFSSFNSLEAIRSALLNDTVSLFVDTIDPKRGQRRESNFNPASKSRPRGLPVEGTLAKNLHIKVGSGRCNFQATKPGTQVQMDSSQDSPASPETPDLAETTFLRKNEGSQLPRRNERGSSTFSQRGSSSRRKIQENYQTSSSKNIYSNFMKDI